MSICFCFAGFIGNKLRIAGNKIRVFKSAIITPRAEKTHKSDIGAIAAVENDSKPAAVVSEVIIIGKPECPIE